MNSSTWRFGILTILIMAFLTSCQTPISPAAGRADPLYPGAYPQIALLNPSLQEHLVFERPIVDDAGSSMIVSIPLRSIWMNGELFIQYRFFFLDSNGVHLEPDPAWRRITLDPQASRQVQGVALQSDAVDWRLEIRSAR